MLLGAPYTALPVPHVDSTQLTAHRVLGELDYGFGDLKRGNSVGLRGQGC